MLNLQLWVSFDLYGLTTVECYAISGAFFVEAAHLYFLQFLVHFSDHSPHPYMYNMYVMYLLRNCDIFLWEATCMQATFHSKVYKADLWVLDMLDLYLSAFDEYLIQFLKPFVTPCLQSRFSLEPEYTYIHTCTYMLVYCCMISVHLLMFHAG